MATIKIDALGDLRSKMTHIQSGTEVMTDAPTDNHGKGEFFSPTDLVAAALGSCILTLMELVAGRLEVDLKGTQILIDKIMASEPRRIGEIIVHVHMPDDYSEKVRLSLERAAATCPVSKTLHPDVIQNINFHYGKLTIKQ